MLLKMWNRVLTNYLLLFNGKFGSNRALSYIFFNSLFNLIAVNFVSINNSFYEF
jgi:hypothetical protein